MGFEQLLGNERLKDNLRQSLRSGRTSHFYLISGPEGSGKHTLARLLSAALMCRSEQRPCMGCAACRKVMAATHPDVIEVTDPEHKNVPVKQVRQVREDMFIKPNEGARKIYIFPQELGIEGQNALLKVLEEPPSYGAFLLLADNPEKLLPTVRSRCVELSLTGLREDVMEQALSGRFPGRQREEILMAVRQSGGWMGQAIAVLEGSDRSAQTQAFAQAFAQRDALELTRLMVGMEKWKRDQLIEELEQWRKLLGQSLICRSTGGTVTEEVRRISVSRSGVELMEAIKELEKCIRYAQGNVSVAAICGYLQWALR